MLSSMCNLRLRKGFYTQGVCKTPVENNGFKFSIFVENQKPTYPRSLTNTNQDKHKENQTMAHHNQSAES